LALMVVGFFIAFASLGFADGLSRFIPIYRAKGEHDKIRYLIKFSKRVLFISGIFSAIILWFSAETTSISIFHNEGLILFLKIFAILIPIQLMSSIFFSIIRSYEKINISSFGANILQNFFKLIFVISFVFVGLKSASAVSSSFLLGTFVGLVFAYLYSRIKLPQIFIKKEYISRKDKHKIILNVFFYSWPLILFGIIGSLMFWLDSILIGYFKDAFWVGIYNAAVPIAALLVMSQEIFIQMFFPMITREIYSKKLVVAKELSKQINKWIFIINLPILALVLLFPGVFINLFFGADYLFAINSLRFLALGQFAYSMSAISNNLLLSRGKSKWILNNLIFVSVINFFLNYLLIPHYGINGASFATFFSFFILAVLVIIENYKINGIFPFRRKLLNVFISAVIPAGLLYWAHLFIEVNLNILILFGIFFALIYGTLILLTKAFDINDFEIIRNFFKRILISN